MEKMNPIVKEQLKIAENALRRAINFGSNESPYTLGNIVNALKDIDSALFTSKVEEMEQNKPELLFEDNIIGSHIKGGMGDDVISFGGNV